MHKEEYNTDCKISYVAWNLNDEIRFQSSSGGIFSSLAENVIKNGGYVVGAIFTSDISSVKHVITNQLSDLQKLRGSKYLQSYVEPELYQEVRSLLEQKVKILFSGTPCQIAGLKGLLHKSYDNLITVDIICHRVPSPYAWRRYIEDMCKTSNDSILNVNFGLSRMGGKSLK